MRWLVIFCLVAIVVSMGSALVFLYRGREGGSKRMLRALQIRVGLSVGLFLFLMLSYKLGFIGVPCSCFEREMVLGIKMASSRAEQNHSQHNRADGHMKPMETSQHEERRAKYPSRELKI